MRTAGICSLISLLGMLFAPLQAEQAIDFARDIRPILSENCFHCHGPDAEHRKADLRLDLKDHAFAEKDGLKMIVPGNLKDSEVWYRIITEDKGDLMPPPKSHKTLTAEQKDLIRDWIASGADWSEHWSFVPPQKVAAGESKSPIDQFIHKRLEAKGMSPSPQADPVTLARRLHLDLTGLPPTPERMREFLAAFKSNPDAAYESLVEELLTSPHFGERMALMWLDAARYGDTSVMHADGPRTMWPWRDWVVDAYNDNKPFDLFSIEQLAGDLIPNATVAQQIASGFNRNHATSDEGGAIPEELRVSYVVDRVQTTANVWMGLTMECAQCHDHKYDPISQKEYYEFYAFFNNHVDPGMQTRRGNEAPFVEVKDPAYEAEFAAAEAKVETTRAALAKGRDASQDAFQKWAATQKADPTNATDGLVEGLAHWFPLDEKEGDELVDHAGALHANKLDGRRLFFNRDKTTKALRLDGKSEFTTGHPMELEQDQPFSFTTWVRLEGGGGAVMSCMDPEDKLRGFDLWIQGETVGTHIIHSWPANAIKVVTKAKLEQEKWHHVAISYDGSSKAEGVSIWIDGVRSETEISNNSLDGKSIVSKAPFTIGSRYKGGKFKGSVSDLRIYHTALTDDQIPLVQANPLPGILATTPDQRTEAQNDLLYSHYLVSADAGYQKLAKNYASSAVAALKMAQTPTTSMIMADNPQNKMRATYMLNRGAYDQPMKDKEVTAAVPAIFPPLGEDEPHNRLGLAHWLFRDDHPLTARVAVNQLWQVFFGYGLVHTPGDFGAQGSFPTHPELLDWLSVDFREHGWNVKRLIRQMVTSEAYRQSSVATDQLLAQDPDNLWLARANRFRLQAEFIRDTALYTSGLLEAEMGGEGVKPYQPPGLWAEVGLGGNPKFVQDKGEKLYRRSLYTYWKRSAPPPSMLIFDAPTRETCTMQRPRTNTPLQALVTMNDVQFVEASKFLAQRMMTESANVPEAIAQRGFELVTLRSPNEREMGALMDVYHGTLATYQQDIEAAKALLDTGEAKTTAALAPDQHAAWTVVANLLLNLDETLTRE